MLTMIWNLLAWFYLHLSDHVHYHVQTMVLVNRCDMI